MLIGHTSNLLGRLETRLAQIILKYNELAESGTYNKPWNNTLLQIWPDDNITKHLADAVAMPEKGLPTTAQSIVIVSLQRVWRGLDFLELVISDLCETHMAVCQIIGYGN